MHPFSVLTIGIFVAGYTTARWDLVTRLYELAIFAWDHEVVVSCPVPPLRNLGAIRIDLSVFLLVARRIRIRRTVTILPRRFPACGTSGSKRVRPGTTIPRPIGALSADPPPRQRANNHFASTLGRPVQEYLHESS